MLSNILSGLKVIDLTQNIAGPFCTQILGDLGADIIKVERPGRGDDTRAWPPQVGGQAAMFLATNRNKRSICIDFHRPEGAEVIRRMVKDADVLVHSLKPGSAEAQGLGYDDLQPLNPQLLYCAISAFGGVGPLGNLPGYDPLMQAFTGIMSTTGNPGEDSVRVGASLIDMGTGMWLALGVLGGVLQRGKTGKGALIEASLLETGVTWMTFLTAGFLASGKVPEKMGSAMSIAAPYELFACSDGHVFIAAANDGLFGRVCTALGLEALQADDRFSNNTARVANRTALHDVIEATTLQLDVAGAAAALRRAGAPCSELNNIPGMLAHEQVQAVDLVVPLPIEGSPDHRVTALPLRMQGERSAAMSPPPHLGEHTSDILTGLGYDPAEIAQMTSDGISA